MSPIHTKDKFSHQRSRYLHLVSKNPPTIKNKPSKNSAVQGASPQNEGDVDYGYINKDLIFSLSLAVAMIALLFAFSFYNDQIPYFQVLLKFIYPS